MWCDVTARFLAPRSQQQAHTHHINHITSDHRTFSINRSNRHNHIPTHITTTHSHHHEFREVFAVEDRIENVQRMFEKAIVVCCVEMAIVCGRRTGVCAWNVVPPFIHRLLPLLDDKHTHVCINRLTISSHCSLSLSPSTHPLSKHITSHHSNCIHTSHTSHTYHTNHNNLNTSSPHTCKNIREFARCFEIEQLRTCGWIAVRILDWGECSRIGECIA